MTLLRATLIIAVSAVVCSVVGLVIGFCLGKFAPAYYYSVFPPRTGEQILL